MKNYYRIYKIALFGILAVCGLVSVLRKENTYSENENRYLETFPRLSRDGVVSGRFQKKFEEAFSDQFIGRDIWMGGTTVVDKIMGKKEVGGIYLGKENYYITGVQQNEIDQKQYMQNLRYVEYLGGYASAQTSLLLAPSPGSIMKNVLPAYAPYYNDASMYKVMNGVLKNVKKIDVRSTLKEYSKQNQVYFRTDHHWTLFGAYAAYSVYCDSNKFNKHTYGYFLPKKISDYFLGTTYSKVMDPAAEEDKMYAATNIPQAFVVCDGTEQKGIYDVEKLTQKDKYGYYFGGNYGEVLIKTEQKSQKKLLVIKDSYANSFVPFLMEDFDSIIMIDLRYYKDSVRELVKKEKFDNILILYEMSNFAQDTNLYKLVH